jgi:hypothetical protein
MEIINLEYKDSRNSHYLYNSITNNSKAVIIPGHHKIISVMITDITTSVTLQYTLGDKRKIVEDTAIWYNTSIGTVSSTSGLSINTPITAIRFLSDGEYTIEILT